MDQIPQHKSSHTEPLRRESGMYPWMKWYSSDRFRNKTTVAKTLRSTINKWDILKLRSYCKAKDTVDRNNWQPKDWQNIFTNPTSNRGLVSRVYKELKKLLTKTPNNPIKNGVQNWIENSQWRNLKWLKNT